MCSQSSLAMNIATGTIFSSEHLARDTGVLETREQRAFIAAGLCCACVRRNALGEILFFAGIRGVLGNVQLHNLCDLSLRLQVRLPGVVRLIVIVIVLYVTHRGSNRALTRLPRLRGEERERERKGKRKS